VYLLKRRSGSMVGFHAAWSRAERLVESARAWTYLAMSRLYLRRLARIAI